MALHCCYCLFFWNDYAFEVFWIYCVSSFYGKIISYYINHSLRIDLPLVVLLYWIIIQVEEYE
jgi:uncharacterized membrane protein YjjP (DUF1212 family)